MPRLSSLGSALCGIAGVPLAIDGSTPATFTAIPSGNWAWLTDTVIFGQAEFSSSVNKVYTYDVGSTTLTEILGSGALDTLAGNGVWAIWGATGGVVTSVGGLGPFPLGKPLHISYQGDMALLTSYAAGSGIKIYNTSGVQIDGLNGTFWTDPVRARDGVLTVLPVSGTGWIVRDYLTQTNLSLLQRSIGINWMVPVFDGTDYWLLERDAADRLMIRQKDSTTAWIVAGPAGTLFQPDVMYLGAGVVRIAWSTTIGEEAANLIVMDLTLATGANDVATVVAGALVFVAQAALTSTTVTGTLIPGGGGGGGVIPGGSGSAGRAVINARVAPPPPVRAQQKYPHVPDIKDFAAKQTARLLWDQASGLTERTTALQTTVDAQAEVITELRRTVTELARRSNVAYRGVEEDEDA